MAASRHVVACWLVAGWIGFALLPWYYGGATPAGSALALGFGDGRWWLLPFVLPLLLGLVSVVGRQEDARRGGLWLVAAGALGLAWCAIEGFAIGHRGWSFEWLAVLFGAGGPSQAG